VWGPRVNGSRWRDGGSSTKEESLKGSCDFNRGEGYVHVSRFWVVPSPNFAFPLLSECGITDGNGIKNRDAKPVTCCGLVHENAHRLDDIQVERRRKVYITQK
jgi:hypothetical protein